MIREDHSFSLTSRSIVKTSVIHSSVSSVDCPDWASATRTFHSRLKFRGDEQVTKNTINPKWKSVLHDFATDGKDDHDWYWSGGECRSSLQYIICPHNDQSNNTFRHYIGTTVPKINNARHSTIHKQQSHRENSHEAQHEQHHDQFNKWNCTLGKLQIIISDKSNFINFIN
jgi:hypothetical protein